MGTSTLVDPHDGGEPFGSLCCHWATVPRPRRDVAASALGAGRDGPNARAGVPVRPSGGRRQMGVTKPPIQPCMVVVR